MPRDRAQLQDQETPQDGDLEPWLAAFIDALAEADAARDYAARSKPQDQAA